MSLWTGLALRKRMKGYYRFPSWTMQLIKNRNSSPLFKELWKQSSHLTPSQREIFSWCSNNALLTSHKAEMRDFFIVDIYRKHYQRKVQKWGDEACAPVPQQHRRLLPRWATSCIRAAYWFILRIYTNKIARDLPSTKAEPILSVRSGPRLAPSGTLR